MLVLLLLLMIGLVFGGTLLVMNALSWAVAIAVVVLVGGAVLGNSTDID